MNKEPHFCKFCLYRREPFCYHMERIGLKRCAHFLLSIKKLNEVQLEVLELYKEKHSLVDLKELEFNFVTKVLKQSRT